MVPPISQTQEQPQAEVVQLFDPERRNPSRPPPPTDAELIEYRLLRPRLLAMLEQWEALTSPSGCPVARQILLGR